MERLNPKFILALAVGSLLYGGIHFSRSTAEPQPQTLLTPSNPITRPNLPPIIPSFAQVETDLTFETFCDPLTRSPQLRVTTFPLQQLVGLPPYYISYGDLDTSAAQYIALERQTITNLGEDAPFSHVVNPATIGINPFDSNTPIIRRPVGSTVRFAPTYASSSNFPKRRSEKEYSARVPC